MAAVKSLLEGLIGAALAAGREIGRIYRGGFTVRLKQDDSPVTAADHAAERVILEHLARLAPDIPVVAEERVAAGQIPEIGERFFLVDPLDGTKEFVSRNGEFTVNIALVEAGVPTLGVVYAPEASWVYAGDTRARVAFRMPFASHDTDLRRDRVRVPIRVRTPQPSEPLIVVASRSHRDAATDAYLARLHIARTITVGSSLKFCLVAAGEADLYPRATSISEWDTAAGHAVVVAAGGRVIDARGEPLRYGKPGFRSGAFVAAGAFEPPPLEPV
ncbi:MAG TPA: 3'(2'),5'-bisphosphate nucleotidase CysQ [Steroidobacteraceae bacterium]|nr:3'(2'),5'-bisphosphate nucleotidase CysQ [Steroidobacteraceae bacterium]